MAALTPKSYAGMRYDHLGISGLQWPCPDSAHPGQKRNWRFSRPPRALRLPFGLILFVGNGLTMI
jgi:hypothetical protein